MTHTYQWLNKSNIKANTEVLIMAAQEQALNTRAVAHEIYHTESENNTTHGRVRENFFSTATTTTTTTGWLSGINGRLNNMFLDPEDPGSIPGEEHGKI